MYCGLLLYFFTGTGNTSRAAAWLADCAREQGLDTRVTAINDAQPLVERAVDGQLLGLLSPTHGFTAPWQMIRFAARLPRGQGQHAFVLLTRAGMKIGRVFAPGFEGTGAYLLALILFLKGYKVRGVTGLDMPSNWTVIHPSYSSATSEAIQARSKPRAQAFITQLLEGKTAFRDQGFLLLGLALAPASAAYVLMGRFLLAKLFYASEKCVGCGWCARTCPVGAIRMHGKNSPRPYWTYLCESCARCYNECPNQAVEASYPFAALALYLSNVPLAAFVLDRLARSVTAAAGLKGTIVEWIINYPYKLLSFAAAYAVFSLLLRIPWINHLLTLATPTHYFRRYPGPGSSI